MDAGVTAMFDEIVVEPGANIAIRGILSVERDPTASSERGYRDDAPTIVHLVGSPSTSLTILRIW